MLLSKRFPELEKLLLDLANHFGCCGNLTYRFNKRLEAMLSWSTAVDDTVEFIDIQHYVTGLWLSKKHLSIFILSLKQNCTSFKTSWRRQFKISSVRRKCKLEISVDSTLLHERIQCIHNKKKTSGKTSLFFNTLAQVLDTGRKLLIRSLYPNFLFQAV